MNSNEKTLTRGKIIIISIATFLLILALFTAITIIMMVNRSEPTTNSNVDIAVSSDIAVSDALQDASQTFAESILTEVSESNKDEDLSSESDEESALDEINHGWVINEYGYTYVYGDSGYEQFNFSNTVLERYANSLNALVECVPNGTRIFNITVPVSSTFASIPRDIYVSDNFYNKSQSAFVSTVSTKLDDRIKNISIVSAMQEHFDSGEYLFYRTDKNWTSVGAYVAYKNFCENAGIVPYTLSNFIQKDVGDYLGSFYKATNAEKMLENPDRVICYATVPAVKTDLTVYDSGIVYTDYSLCENSVTEKNAYDIYLGTVAERYEINTTADGGSLLIIADSSAYPLVPLLASHYRKIDVINPKYFDTNINEFLEKRHYDDIITMCYSTNATSGDYIPAFNTMIGATIDG